MPVRNPINALHAAAAEARNAAEALRFAATSAKLQAAENMADEAICAAGLALEHVSVLEPADAAPLSRRAQLAQAGWCALLAGTEEGGTPDDLADAARLFERAARA